MMNPSTFHFVNPKRSWYILYFEQIVKVKDKDYTFIRGK